MKVIIELIKLLDKSKIQPIKTLDFSNTKQNKYKSYYEAILENEHLNEDNLARRFSEDIASSKKYLMFKNRFRKRLINYILFLDSSDSSISTRTVSKTYRFVLISKLLMLLGAKNSSYYYAGKSIKYAKEFELFDLLIILNQIYISKYSLDNLINKLNNEINEMEVNLKFYSNELKVESLYARSGVLISKTEILNKKNFDSYKEIIVELKDIVTNEAVSFKANWLANSCLIEYYEYIGNYKEVLNMCHILEAKLIEKPQFNYKVRQLILSTWKLEAYGVLNNISEAYKILKNLEESVKNDEYNWFHVQRKIFEFHLNSKQYQEAFNTSLKVLSNKNFKNYNSRFKEIWILRQAYMSIICNVLKLENHNSLKNIKIKKVLNSISSMSKDKLGVNLAAIVLEVIYMFFNEEYDKLIDKNLTLMSYKLRHLKPAKLKRATIFFDFIIKTSQKGFVKIELIKQGEKALEKLNNLENQNAERRSYEIIPYEDLIEMMINKKN